MQDQTSIHKDFGEVVHMQRAFFDVRICNLTAWSYRHSSLQAVYRSHERSKHRQYEERISDVEMSSFTPLVFSIFGGKSKLTTVAYTYISMDAYYISTDVYYISMGV